MPLSLPPPVASALNELLYQTYNWGHIDGCAYTLARLRNDPSIPALTAPPPVRPELLTSAHMEAFLLQLESLLLDCHHHTPQSPLTNTNQSTATFPPPLDSQDQL